MNRNYGKLIGNALAYAPSTLDTPAGKILNPKRLSYLQAGWKLIVCEPPAEPLPDGEEYAISGYTETDAEIHAVYKLVPVAKPPRTFSKLRLVNALTERGIWPAVRDWLDTAGFYDLFMAAQDFSESHPQFAAALSAAKSRFGLTDAEIAALLDESVVR